MEKEKKVSNTTEPDKGPKEKKEEPASVEPEEKEYVGLPVRDLKKNLGCG